MTTEDLITEARKYVTKHDVYSDNHLLRGLSDALEAATSTIDRIDTALRADGRSAMRVVAAQEIITQYREGQDQHGHV